MNNMSKLGVVALLIVGSAMRANSEPRPEPRPELVKCWMWQEPPSCLEDCTKVNGHCSNGGDRNEKCIKQNGQCGIIEPQPSSLGAFVPASCDKDGDLCFCIW